MALGSQSVGYQLALRCLSGGFGVALGGFKWLCAASYFYFYFLLVQFCFCQNVAWGGFPTGFPALAEFQDSAPGQPPWKLAGNRRAVLLIVLT